MPRWTCPRCDRQFERANQAHDCAPGITVAELLSRHPAWVSEIYDRIIGHLSSLGPIHEDAVDVGIFLKSDRKIGEFRPLVRSARLYLFLPDARNSPLVQRSVRTGVDRTVHLIKLTSAADIDAELRSWLTESYDLNTD
jgi:uncharacterized protein DUF5655